MNVQRRTAEENIADSRALRIKQGLPRYIVDGHEFDCDDSNLMASGQFAPFLVFDIDRQEYLFTQYTTRKAAQKVADVCNHGEPTRVYRGCSITRASSNSSGMRWESYCEGRFIRAETLASMRQFITDTLGAGTRTAHRR